ncbi:MAG: protein kinase domain-containing protein [Eubacteriales bacterium]
MECNTDFLELYDCLNDNFGEGGNASVKECRDKNTDDIVAIKRLFKGKRKNAEKTSRFKDEVLIMLDNYHQIEGILPVLNYCFDPYWWYAMPIATPIMQHIKHTNAKTIDIVNGCLQLCETLEFLHAKDVSHRDIKPDNIYFFNGRYTFGDFGLVDYPDKTTTFTLVSHQIGAKFTRAPEMERQPDIADGKKADVYSLAKTLWMLLTKNEFGFEGRYDFLDEEHSLTNFELLRTEYLVEIHELLKDSTQNVPDDRPTIITFKKKLSDWLVSNSSEQRKQSKNWNFINKLLFAKSTPRTSIWNDIKEINYVLNIIGHIPAYSHLLFSDGGGLDYHKTELVDNEHLDIITDSFRNRIKPKQLVFESFKHSFWNYFLLELDKQEIVVGTNVSEFEERVVEDKPNHYVSAVDACYGVYDYENGKVLPQTAKIIYRCLDGKFLIVLKSGPYNHIAETYDGRHGNCSYIEFREYIETIEKAYEMHSLLDKELWASLMNTTIQNCTFKKEYYASDITDDNKSNKVVDRNFVKNNFLSFDFIKILQKHNNKQTSKAKYRFKFNESSTFDLSSLINLEKYYLCVNGKVDKKHIHSSDVYVASNKETAICIFREIEKHLDDLCEEHCNKFEMPYFSVKIERSGKPSHLFTKCEIEKLMRDADDRLNNILVIDENGFAHIIQDKSITKFYPVVSETWCSRNNYVGKYSNLSDLDSSYHYCLGKWLLYLELNVGQIMEDYDSNHMSIEELLSEIGKYY